MIRRTKIPPQLGVSPALQTWLQHHGEVAARPVSQATHTFSAANVQERVRHRLTGVPTAFRVVDKDRACDVYRDSSTKAADRFWIWLKCNTAGAIVTLEFT